MTKNDNLDEVLDEESVDMDTEINDVEFEETDAEGAATSDKEKIKKLRQEIKDLQAKNKEYLDGWQRARADLVNKDRQMVEDRVMLIKSAASRTVEGIIPVLDSYEMARKNKSAWESVDGKWRVGVEYIFTQLQSALESEGLVAVAPSVGSVFDARTMQAVEEVPTEDEAKDHTVAELIQSGYTLGGKELREAKVKVFVKK
jgi:molecular chaperone GrpE